MLTSSRQTTSTDNQTSAEAQITRVLGLAAVIGAGFGAEHEALAANSRAPLPPPPARVQVVNSSNAPLAELHGPKTFTTSHQSPPAVVHTNAAPAQAPAGAPAPQDSNRGWWTMMLLSAVGLAAGVRGTIKGAYATYIWMRHRRAYRDQSSVSPPAFDLEIFKQESGRVLMKTRAGDQIDFQRLIPNMAVRHMFTAARKRCTEMQPFPYVELMRSERIWGLPTRDARDAASALQIINKSLRERMSSHSKEGHDDDDFGISVREQVRFAIPSVEVKAAGGRDESIILVSAQNFRLFGDPAKVEELRRDNPRQGARIDLLTRAYSVHASFLERAGKNPMDTYHYEPDGERNSNFKHTDYVWARVVITNKVRRSDVEVRNAS